MIIHKKDISKDITIYYFTKSKNKCLSAEYNKRNDYGKFSTSSTDLNISIHYQNSWVKDELTQIRLEEVPSVIQDILNYLK